MTDTLNTKLAISIRPSYNWKLDEPFVQLVVADTMYALTPDVVRNIGLKLIEAAGQAVTDGMLMRVLIDGCNFQPPEALAVAQALNHQAREQAAGRVERGQSIRDLLTPNLGDEEKIQ